MSCDGPEKTQWSSSVSANGGRSLGRVCVRVYQGLTRMSAGASSTVWHRLGQRQVQYLGDERRERRQRTYSTYVRRLLSHAIDFRLSNLCRLEGVSYGTAEIALTGISSSVQYFFDIISPLPQLPGQRTITLSQLRSLATPATPPTLSLPE